MAKKIVSFLRFLAEIDLKNRKKEVNYIFDKKISNTMRPRSITLVFETIPSSKNYTTA